MPAFRIVSADQAGPNALGILVPQGRQTLVIVRPRPLVLDLVMAKPSSDGGPGDGFLEMGRHVAQLEAQRLGRSLVRWAEGGTGKIAAIPARGAAGYWVYADAGAMPLIACPRIEGQPFRPAIFGTLEAALQTAKALTGILCPQGDANQELYTNVQHFAR